MLIDSRDIIFITEAILNYVVKVHLSYFVSPSLANTASVLLALLKQGLEVPKSQSTFNNLFNYWQSICNLPK